MSIGTRVNQVLPEISRQKIINKELRKKSKEIH